MLFDYDNIKSLHIEPTQMCQAACPMCDRNNYDNGKTNHNLVNAQTGLDFWRDHIGFEFMSNIQHINMCGNHGDPIFNTELLDIIRFFKQANPKMSIRISTNGGKGDKDFWTSLAEMNVKVTFSVDGLENTNHLYRIGVKWDNVEESMWNFCSAGGKAIWTFLVFKHNEHQIEEARQLAKLIGIDRFQTKMSNRFIATPIQKAWGHNQIQTDYTIEPPENEQYRHPSINNTMSKEDMLNELMRHPVKCKTAQFNEIYVSARGEITPCCWTAAQLWKPFEKKGDNPIWKLIDNWEDIVAYHTPLKEILRGPFFQRLEQSMHSSNRLMACNRQCTAKSDDIIGFEKQWSR